MPLAVPFDQLAGRLTFGNEAFMHVEDVALEGPMLAATVTGKVGRPSRQGAQSLDLDIRYELDDPALASMLGDQFFASQSVAADGVASYENPLAPKTPHFNGKAKNVIFLFMYGGPSHVDTFDYKPDLYSLDGKTISNYLITLNTLEAGQDAYVDRRQGYEALEDRR